MTDSELRYDLMVQNALRSVVREALEHTVKFGLVGDHHFYIAFDTTHADVRLPTHLKERFPEEMTIVLQHQYWDLEVDQDGFSVTLNFDRRSSNLQVPFAALKGFFDPSVQFGLQFEGDEDRTEPYDEGDFDSDLEELSDFVSHQLDQDMNEDSPQPDTESADASDDEEKTGEVIALDQFRKKP